MKRLSILSSLLIMAACSAKNVGSIEVTLKTEVRPSSTPLITVDPYLSIWSATDHINESPTVHWTGVESPLLAYVRVDGVTYRVLGHEEYDYDVILNSINEGLWDARCMKYTAPAKGWNLPDFDDSSWEKVPGAVGSADRSTSNTIWEGDDTDIWLRRTLTLDKPLESIENIYLTYTHDEDFELYLNGVEIVNTGSTYRDDVLELMSPEAAALLRKGENILAAHCHNSNGDCYLDFGIKQRKVGKDTIAAAQQTSLSVLPTRTVAGFACGPVDVDLIFTAPLLMEDLDLLSRPVNYITVQTSSNDGAAHDVQFFFAASPRQAVNIPAQAVTTGKGAADGIDYISAGTREQNILGTKGDNVRIDWGYVYLASPSGKGALTVASYFESVTTFAAEGIAPAGAEEYSRESTNVDMLSLNYVRDMGKVGKDVKADYVMLAYDDLYSVQFFGENLRPYWNRGGDKTITGQLALAAAEYSSLMERCSEFDTHLMYEANTSGGREYAELCALAYRQAVAAHKLVESPEAGLLWLSKENFSNGSIGTVDVTYPSAPLFLYYNVELAKGLLNHIFFYSESGRWTKPFAAHDVGTYPLANGQTYGGDMPVEESGNMLILTAAIAKVEGNADYARKHWDVLSTWADYLSEFGLDPENQLCTDDFAGHFAHNTNLSVKAIMGIESYSVLAGMLGKEPEAEKYHAMAVEMAGKWKEMAADGDHYRLTFDKSGTWSQKYNLVWDKILGTHIFDPSIAETEIEFYKKNQNVYGLPLDNRMAYTKTDWIIWTATMASTPEDFECFIKPIYQFQNETIDRVPMSDWIWTDSPEHRGFQARSVVGGYFIKMLSDRYIKLKFRMCET